MTNQYECIDLSYLESIAEGDKSIVKELITIFLEQIPEFTEGLEKSFKEEQWLDVAAIAHKAKSSVISMGLEDLGNQDLKNLELLAKEMRVQQIKQKNSVSTEEESEAEQLTKNLEGYDKERQAWIKENTNPENIAGIIEKFKQVCAQAESELKIEIGQ